MQVVNINRILVASVLLAGCASVQPSPVHIVSQPGAPVAIVSIFARDYSLLGSVVVKNRTDRVIESFEVTWSIYCPAKCRDSDPRLQEVTGHGQRVCAERRGIWKPHGWLWPVRPLLPHETTRITSLHLTQEELAELMQKYSARKLGIQIAIPSVNFLPPDCKGFECSHSGPDWQDERLLEEAHRHLNILDFDDAEREACP